MGLRPLPNIIRQQVANHVKVAGKSSVLQTMPIKSEFKGLNLAPLDKDKLVKPKKYASQGERLKDFYNSKGYPYLLPHQEWSDKKIKDTIDLFGKDLDKMVESGTLNKQNLQEAINVLAPEAKGKIIIKDFSDLASDMKKQNYSQDVIDDFLQNAGAVTDPKPRETFVYLKFENMYYGQGAKTNLKVQIEHELKHALSARLQNTAITDICKNDDYKCKNQYKIFGEIFSLFETNYYRQQGLASKTTTQENMLRMLGFGSAKALHADFEKKLKKTIDWAKGQDGFNIGNDKKSWKQFFNFLKNMAIDEKQAYQTSKRYRELTFDVNSPTARELDPLKYEEMAKFFNQKRVQVNR